MNEKTPCDFCKGSGIEPGHTDCAWCDSTGVLGGLSPAPVPPAVPAAWDQKALELAGKAYQQINAYAHRDRGYLVSVIQCSIISGMNFANAQRDEGLAREAELVEALRLAKCHIANAQFALSKENPGHNWLPNIRRGLSDAKAVLAQYGCADGEKAQ